MTTVAIRVAGHDSPTGDLTLAWTGRQHDSIHTNLRALVADAEPNDAALDLLGFAVSIFAADRAVPRRLAPDRWTRSIEVHFPQLSPERWPTDQAGSLLRQLTGDRWTLRPYEDLRMRGRVLSNADTHLPLPADPWSVALFSGGLDSFAFRASQSTGALRYVSHQDKSQLGGLQRHLAEGVGGGSTRQFSVEVRRGGPLDYELERSTRSRSLVFIAAAAVVAVSTGGTEVIVPENGFISLNPPLVPARRGTASTRTTHPWTLHLLEDLLHAGGLGLQITNPFLGRTKGDITAIAATHADRALLAATVSCSRARARRSSKVHFGNCGYCYPCLVRRAGFVASGIPDDTTYRADPMSDPSFLRSAAGEDFRAVVTRVREPFTMRDLTSAAPLPRGAAFDALLDVIERSRLELLTMLDLGLAKEVGLAIGW